MRPMNSSCVPVSFLLVSTAFFLQSCALHPEGATHTQSELHANASKPDPIASQSEGKEPEARSRKSKGDRNSPRGTAGDFDFYVLSLSWSPQHCSTPAGEHDGEQCGGSRQYNFVVHGLWPQYDPRGWPQSCGGDASVSPALIQQMLPLMPSKKLIRHEYEKHGTCSGLGQEKYFQTVKQARGKLSIPKDYESPRAAVRTSPAAIKTKFVASNTGLSPDMLGITCSGRFLQEVDVCFTKDLNFRACGRGVRESCPDELIIQPIR